MKRDATTLCAALFVSWATIVLAGCAGDEQVVDPDFQLMDVIGFDAGGRGMAAETTEGDVAPLDPDALQGGSSSGGEKTPPDPVVSMSAAFGGKYEDELRDVTRAGGDVFAVGFTQSFGAGAKDALGVRMDGCGAIAWVKAWGGAGEDEALAASAVGSQVWVAGSTTTGAGVQAWAFRIGHNGLMNVSTALGGTAVDTAADVVAMPDGGAFLAGSTESYGPAAPKYESLLAARLDKDGKLLWARAYGKKYTRNTAAAAVAVPGNAGFALVGGAEGWGSGKDDLWLLRLDAQGKFHWAMAYGSDQDDEATDLVFAPDGGFLVAGHSDGFGAKSDDMVAVKVTGGGAVQWASKLASVNGDDRAYKVLRQGTGYLLVGASDGTSTDDGFQARIAPNGKHEWTRAAGQSKSERMWSAVTLADGSVLSVGYTTGGNGGQRDAWIARSEVGKAIGCGDEPVAETEWKGESIQPTAASFKIAPVDVPNDAAQTWQVKTTPAPPAHELPTATFCTAPSCL